MSGSGTHPSRVISPTSLLRMNKSFYFMGCTKQAMDQTSLDLLTPSIGRVRQSLGMRIWKQTRSHFICLFI